LKAGNHAEACEIFNLGTGNGVTVFEVIRSFEKVTGLQLNYSVGPRRPGDIEAIYANNEKAIHKLGWKLSFSLDEMMATAWQWELKIQEDERLNHLQQAAFN
jgi:UDP-glucose 4-epimerase